MSGEGGSFSVDKSGQVARTQYTKNHPDGNRPRTDDGTPINHVVQPVPKAPQATTTKKGKE